MGGGGGTEKEATTSPIPNGHKKIRTTLLPKSNSLQTAKLPTCFGIEPVKALLSVYRNVEQPMDNRGEHGVRKII